MRGVASRGLVGGGQVLERVSPVAVVVVVVAGTTCCMVVVKGRVIICILTRFLILDPGLSMSNREHDLLLSRLLLPY